MDDTIKKTIINDLGLGALPADKQEETLMRVGKMIFQGVLMRITENLTEEAQGELETLLGAEKPEEEALLAFLTKNVPNLEEIVKAEVARFKEESAKVMGTGGTK
jgi:hypothetical protein